MSRSVKDHGVFSNVDKLVDVDGFVNFQMGRFVVPVVDLAFVMGVPFNYAKDVLVSGGGTSYQCVEVPDGEMWLVNRMSFGHWAPADFEMVRFYIYDGEAF